MRKNSLRFYELSETSTPGLCMGGRSSISSAHMHHSWSVGVVERGFRQFETRKETFIISAGECFIIPPRLPHTCHTSVDSWHEYWILCVPQQVIQQNFFHRFTLNSSGFRLFCWVQYATSPLYNSCETS